MHAPQQGLTFLMRSHKNRSTRGRSIPRSLQRPSISQLTFFHFRIMELTYEVLYIYVVGACEMYKEERDVLEENRRLWYGEVWYTR